MNYLKLACILAAFSLLLIACSDQKPVSNTTAENVSPPRNTVLKSPEPLVENTLEAGKTLYANNCAKCHKEDGTGGKVEIDGKTLKADWLLTIAVRKPE